MVYFTSDLHLGHERIIEYCRRPFATVEQMDEVLIENWNKTVHKLDTVYIMGDFVWKKQMLPYYLSRLKGKKVLLKGNHDTWAKNREANAELFALFERVELLIEESICSHPMTLCHYPMLEWNMSRKDESNSKLGYLIHGHIHNSKDLIYRTLFELPHALNAGVDINGYRPVDFETLLMNNQSFKKNNGRMDKPHFTIDKF